MLVSLESSDQDAGRDVYSLRKLAHCRPAEVSTLGELVGVGWRYQRVPRELVCDPLVVALLFWTVVLVIDEVGASCGDEVPRLVVETEPKLVVSLVTKAELEQRLVTTQPTSGAT